MDKNKRGIYFYSGNTRYCLANEVTDEEEECEDDNDEDYDRNVDVNQSDSENDMNYVEEGGTGVKINCSSKGNLS